jgi:UDP-glucose 4-epimerase
VQFPINPYGKAKKMAEDIILDFSKSKKADMAVMILRLAVGTVKWSIPLKTSFDCCVTNE